MARSIVPLSGTVFSVALTNVASELLGEGIAFYNKEITTTSGAKRRYLRAAWVNGTAEENDGNFTKAHEIFFSNLGGYMYLTIVGQTSFAVAVHEVAYDLEAQIYDHQPN